MLEFLKAIISFFNDNKIEYMLSGSVALSVYTVPRSTRDFDFIVHLNKENAEKLANRFKEGYYCEIDSIKDAIKNKSMFNIIDHASGFKADFVILKDEPFRQTEFARRKEIDLSGISIFIVSPEDLLISKLIWIQDFRSSIQMEDIQNLASLENIDWQYIRNWLNSLNLNTFNLF